MFKSATAFDQNISAWDARSETKRNDPDERRTRTMNYK